MVLWSSYCTSRLSTNHKLTLDKIERGVYKPLIFMPTLKGTLAPTSSFTLRGVEIKIKKIPFGKLQEFQREAENLKSGDEDSLEYVKQVILDYTDITVEEDYDPFGTTEDALNMEEIEQLFGAILTAGKKKESGNL